MTFFIASKFFLSDLTVIRKFKPIPKPNSPITKFDVCSIFSINGTNEKLDYSERGWIFKNKTIKPSCFSYPWYSGDNFEAIAGFPP